MEPPLQSITDKSADTADCDRNRKSLVGKSADLEPLRLRIATSRSRERQQQHQSKSNICPPVTTQVSPTPTRRSSSLSRACESRVAADVVANQCYDDWPTSSATSLPALSESVVTGLQNHNLNLVINEECTSLRLVPSGRHVVAGFSDGTLRIFDLTGRFSPLETTTSHSLSVGSSHTMASSSMDNDDDEEAMFDDSTISDQHTLTESVPSHRKSRSYMVASKQHQRFGAVACQIHARGVHTSLLMDVDVSEDGMYVFGGVLRGNMEMVAAHLGGLENYHNRQDHADRTTSANDNTQEKSSENLLDLITVYRHSDAKLRGFGACTRVRKYRSGDGQPKYLLFTGKAIKNIHIWSFEPPACHDDNDEDAATWQCLYDTQTNGNTISLLHFRYNPDGQLQGVSKSDGQKLRVWDLSFEQHLGDPKHPCYRHSASRTRPKRPSFCDVTNTEAALGVCGGFCLCGGAEFYNQLSIVSLDAESIKSPFNHTELALPDSTTSTLCKPPRRQQRGDLKSVINVVGIATDSSHILLELSDRSVVHYRQGEHNIAAGPPQLQTLSTSSFSYLAEGVVRKTCLARIGSEGAVVSAVATYNPQWGRGSISLHPMDSSEGKGASAAKEGFWGFLPNFQLSARSNLSKSPILTDRQAITVVSLSKESKESTITSPLAEPLPDSLVSVELEPASAQEHVFDTPDHKPSRAGRRDSHVRENSVMPSGAQVSPDSSSEPSSRGLSRAMKGDGEILKYIGRRLHIENETDGKKEAKCVDNKSEHRGTENVSAKVPRKIAPASLESPLRPLTAADKIAFSTTHSNSQTLKPANETRGHDYKKCKEVHQYTENVALPVPRKILTASLEATLRPVVLVSTKDSCSSKANEPVMDLTDEERKVKQDDCGEKRNHTGEVLPTVSSKIQISLDSEETLQAVITAGTHDASTTESTSQTLNRRNDNGEFKHDDRGSRQCIGKESPAVPRKIPRRSVLGTSSSMPLITANTPDPPTTETTTQRLEVTVDSKDTRHDENRGVHQRTEKALPAVPHRIPRSAALDKPPRPVIAADTPGASTTKSITRDQEQTVSTRDVTHEEGRPGHQHSEKTSPAVPRKTPRSSFLEDDPLKPASTRGASMIESKARKLELTHAKSEAKHEDSSDKHFHNGKVSSAVPRKIPRLLPLEVPLKTATAVDVPGQPPTKTSNRMLDLTSTSRKVPKRRLIQSSLATDRCMEPFHKRIRLLLDEIPTLSVRARFPSFAQKSHDLASSHEAARMALAAHHRASHEMLRRKILYATGEILRSLSCSSLATVGACRTSLEEALQDYSEILTDLLVRQEMEAGALAAQQTVELQGSRPAPILAVSFPFPEVFDDARNCVDAAIQARHRSKEEATKSIEIIN